MRFLVSTWNSIEPTIISNCFKKGGFLHEEIDEIP